MKIIYGDALSALIQDFSFFFLCVCVVLLQYLECEADKKPSQLVDLLVKNKSKKIIV